MNKCDCCREEDSSLTKFMGYELCPKCYMGFINKITICENNKKFVQRIAELEYENTILKKTNENGLRKTTLDIFAICSDIFREEIDKLKEENAKLQEQLKKTDKLPVFVKKKEDIM